MGRSRQHSMSNVITNEEHVYTRAILHYLNENDQERRKDVEREKERWSIICFSDKSRENQILRLKEKKKISKKKEKKRYHFIVLLEMKIFLFLLI